MLVTGVSPQRPTFCPILAHVGSVTVKLALRQVIRSVDYHPTNMIAPNIVAAVMDHVGLHRETLRRIGLRQLKTEPSSVR